MFLALLGLSLAAASAASAASPPHILLIIADDLGFHDLGFKDPLIQTPTLTGLRASGISLEQHYVQPVCAPTRAALMTGRYPHRYGLQFPFCGGDAQGLNLNETLLPQYLAQAGYTRRIVGKWHLGYCQWEFTPTFRGFESFIGYYSCAEDYFTHKVGRGLDFHNDSSPLCGPNCSQALFSAVGNYSTDIFATQAVDVINSHDVSKPLFLYLPWQSVHEPAEVPPEWVVPYNATIPDLRRRTFAGMLSALDASVGKVMAALKATGLDQNLLVVFSADNGGPIYDATHHMVNDAIGSTNYPLRGGKHNSYQGGVRSTAFISGSYLAAKGAQPGTAYSGLMHVVDWVPTLCHIAGCNVSGALLPLDGLDQFDAIFSNLSSPRTKMVVDIEDPTGTKFESFGAGVVRVDNFKLFIGDTFSSRPGDWSPENAYENSTNCRPSTFNNSRPFQLFDVIADPSELNDLATNADYNSTIAQLFAFYQAERAVAHYPQNRGPEGTPNSEDVWVPWLLEPAMTSRT